MKCPKCQFDNEAGAKFCNACGSSMQLVCPECGKVNMPESRFCNECGHNLSAPSETTPHEQKLPLPESEGERKYVTVLFSDLSGYTAMSERLDPEDVKEITTRIFGEAAKIIDKYEGFVEKYAGDAVMALFGVPEAHEDDPIRAIRAAREIHGMVESISPEVEQRIGQALSMHTGINTGLVVTGEVDLEKGTHGVAGDTINVAARLSSLAEADGILVGRKTYQQAEGFFQFEQMEPVVVKGREEAVQTYKVVSLREKPVTLHRLSGLQAKLIGRKAEVAELREAVDLLREGKGRIFSICGEAGTGKSRLVQEFRDSLDHNNIQWLEAHAYAYTRNISYYPLVDLFNRTFEIQEGDHPETIRKKIESALEKLIGERKDLIPYVGSLYSLHYPDLENVSPGLWKARLQEAVKSILSALVLEKPTVFFLEDLHWADPSFVELLRTMLQEMQHPAVVLCVYRPSFSLFTGHQLEGLSGSYREVSLQDLSASEAMDMLESLLQTDKIPSELNHFVRAEVGGNPFYLEELINSLIESDTLIKDDGGWKMTGPIKESSISSSIHGIISDRLDRLERHTKRVLQEASVIGRSFLYEILTRITDLKDQCETCLLTLERLDLIRAKTLDPDMEYIFKHALTQEVVYNGLLKKERQVIHDRIGQVMEQLFKDRLPEFYETLGYHFIEGKSPHKAVEYLMKAGEKSLKRYAVEEANQYYKKAFEILRDKADKTKNEEDLLIDLLIGWAYVLYYRGDFKTLTELYSTHEQLADALEDKARTGMFYAWFGFGLYAREKYRDSFQQLEKALTIGEDIQDQHISGYAHTWLTWTCGELGLMDEAVTHGEKAQDICNFLPHEQYLYFKSLGGIAQAHIYKGSVREALEVGKRLLEYGEKCSNMRSMFMGYLFIGYSYLQAGNFPSAMEYSNKAVNISVDPLYAVAGTLLTAFIPAYKGQIEAIGNEPFEVADFGRKFGCEVWETPARLLLGVMLIADGHMSKGIKAIEDVQNTFLKNDRKWFLCLSEQILGKVYLQIVEGAAAVSMAIIAKNIGFIAKTVPFATKKTEAHFQKAIEIAREIGANGLLGQAYFELGMLHKAKKRTEKARECINEAIKLFRICEADAFLKQAEEVLASLE